uniref:Uncharacterized protein n=1 Tax=Arundo donax TaxID=35708 RepID=A0A0A9B1B2_ARUDO
MGGGGRRR